MTAGQVTYDLPRLRAHGLITRLPHRRRNRVTHTGLRDALFLTRAHDRLFRTGLAEAQMPTALAPETPAPLRR